jgi:hypothetical protein
VRRFHWPAAWLAIIALLIDGLLSTAVVAAASRDTGAPLALCSATAGDSLPGEHAPTLPTRHCALCAAMAVGLIPGRDGGLVARLFAGASLPVITPPIAAPTKRTDYASAQPRAPPLTTS